MRLALVLFAVYLAMYVGFMALAAFAPHRMSEKVAGGVNLAIAYGMGLIVAALVLALVYAVACKREAPGEAERPNS
jgi:uncharacterized membrane protein (DUF485 family)